jgi:hypothetical protein
MPLEKTSYYTHLAVVVHQLTAGLSAKFLANSPLKISSFSSVSIEPETAIRKLAVEDSFLAFNAELYSIEREPEDSWKEVASETVIVKAIDVACDPIAAASYIIQRVRTTGSILECKM